MELLAIVSINPSPTEVTSSGRSYQPDFLWCLTPLSTIFQLYRGGQFYWLRIQEELEKTT